MTTTNQDLAARIREFSVDCLAGEHTDTVEAWALLDEAVEALEPDPAASAAYQPGPGNCQNCGDHDPELDHRGLCPICEELHDERASSYQAGITDAGTAFLAYIKSLEESGRQLLAAVDAMRLSEPNNAPPGPYWLGPFGDWSEEFGEEIGERHPLTECNVGVNWPILVTTCTHLRQVLNSAESRPSAEVLRRFEVSA